MREQANCQRSPRRIPREYCEIQPTRFPVISAVRYTEWLQANTGLLPRSLAFDGKSIGDGTCGMTITLGRDEDGGPVAMIPATGKKEDSEVSEARALLASPQVRLENALL
jgi:hypothetical protein